MELIKFSVIKYRSLIKKCEIGISRFTSIIGPNNEGKSNLLRAIVTAVKILETIGSEPNLQMKKGDKLSMRTRILDDDVYSWQRDYPLSAQRRKRDAGVTTFVLEFLLGDVELEEIRSLTKSVFRKKKVALKLEITKEEIRYSLNLKGIFNKRADKQKLIVLAQYFASRINICYIDAIRTSETAGESMAKLVSLQIRNQLYESAEYKKYQEETQKRKNALLDDIASEVSKVLREFLPGIKQTSVRLNERRFRHAQFWNTADVEINDGELTPLELKGSGVQSLIALALARFVSQQDTNSESCFVLAVEEPESYLHPDAIHRVKAILNSITKTTPVIITTHSPLLTNIEDITANIVVCNHTARSAKTLVEIKKLLGVWRSDNLTHADVVVIVEGASDERIFRHIMSLKSGTLREALLRGSLTIWNAKGCSQMMPLVRVLENEMSRYHIILDDDTSGRNEYKHLVMNNQVQANCITMVRGKDGGAESELEDIFDEAFTLSAVKNKYNLADVATLPKGVRVRKWSEKVKSLYEQTGGVWSDDIEDKVKTLVADAVVSKSDLSFVDSRRMPIVDAICSSVEKLLLADGCSIIS